MVDSDIIFPLIVLQIIIIPLSYWFMAWIAAAMWMRQERGRDPHRWDGIATDSGRTPIQPGIWFGFWLAMNVAVIALVL